MIGHSYGTTEVGAAATRGNHPVIGDVPAFKHAAKTALDCFQAALEHEQRVSEAIRGLYRRAEQADDLDSRPLLNWFLSEQLEEESTVNEIVGRITLTDNDGPGLLRLDDELAQRPARTTENTQA